MDLGLAGKTALVCASTSGLGRATAAALAADGVTVVITGRSEDRVAQVAAELPGAVGIACDLVAPGGVRDGLLANIRDEIDHARAGRPARIRIKVNSIVDETVIDALYRASTAGVQVDLWVRGICTVKAGVPGLSENIRVRSILGRFLEHSRLFWFANGGQPRVGIGSTDLMHRNLDRRVEVLVSLTNPRHIATIENLFALAFDPGTASWWLEEDGWSQRTSDLEGEPLLDLQEHLIQQLASRRSDRTPG